VTPENVDAVAESIRSSHYSRLGDLDLRGVDRHKLTSWHALSVTTRR